MKKLILLAGLPAFSAAPLVACDAMKHEGASTGADKASISTEKTSLKAEIKKSKSKASKTVASASSKKAKI